MKKCSTCKQEKDESLFGADKRMRDGKRSQCKECHTKATLRWRENNPEKVKGTRRKNYVENRDHYLEKSRIQNLQMSPESREKKREYCKKYYRKNREKVLSENKVKWRLRSEKEREEDYLRQREYYEKNKDKIRADARERYQNLSEKQKKQNTERTKAWRHANRDKAKAWSAVGNAILSGKLEKPIYCELCGAFEVKIHAHHEDYSQPLNVLWLCHDCHMSLHSEKRINDINENKSGVQNNGTD